MKRHVVATFTSMVFLATGIATGQTVPQGVARAVYKTISDTTGPVYDAGVSAAAYESLSDESSGLDISLIAAPRFEHAPSAAVTSDPVDGTVIGASALFGTPSFDDVVGPPSCGLPNCATCNSGLSCGIASPGCGLPDPSCGMEETSSGGALSGLFTKPHDSDCTTCGVPACGSLCTRNCPTCCGVGTHFTYAYGDFLYVRPRNADLAYAVPVDGPINIGTVPVQVGSIGILDPDYEAGYRAGLSVALDTVSSLDVRYTMFESKTNDEVSTQAPLVLQSLVNHPSTVSAASDSLSAVASLDIDFDIADASYRHLLVCREVYSLNYVVGARYARMEQDFNSMFVKNGTESVTTSIDFEGGGFRLGLESDRYSCRNRLHVFARGYASFVAGRFRGDYLQSLSFDPEVVRTTWEAGRVVPMLDLEVGVGWTSLSGKLRVAGGYMVSSWFNSLTTPEFIRSVQGNQYHDLGTSVTFDGLTGRVEYRF